jgi:hypothetical protein
MISRSVIEGLELRRMLAGDEMAGCACGCCAMCGNISPNAHPGLKDPTYVLEGESVGYDVVPSNGITPAYATPSGRWGTTASQPVATPTGAAVILTYSFVPDGTVVPGFNGEPTAPSNLFARMRTIYAAFGEDDAARDAYWQGLFHTALTAWGVNAGVTYNRELNDDGLQLGAANTSGVLGVRGDVRISGHNIDGNSGVLAYNFFPSSGGDMVIDTNDNTYTNLANNSRILRNVVTHEAGHGLGFNHTDPIAGTKLMEAFLATNFDGPQFDDNLVANYRYGDRLEGTGRNNTTATATVLGSLPIGSTAQTNISLSLSTDVDVFRITLPEQSTLRITATPGGFSYQSGPQNGATSLFNALTVQNLRLSVQTSAGAPIITNQNLTAAGVAEVISNLTLNAGDYFVSVSSAGGSNAIAQNYGINFERSEPLIPTITAVTPAPRTTALTSITVSFNQAITTSTISSADFVLTRDGVVVPFSGVGVSIVNSTTFTVSGLTFETSRPGLYNFSIAAGADVTNSLGAKPLTGSSSTWQMTAWVSTTTAETLTIEGSGATATMTDSGGAFSVDLTNIPLLTVSGQSNDILNITGAFPRPVDLPTGLVVGTVNLTAPAAGGAYVFGAGSISGTTGVTFASNPGAINVTGDAAANDSYSIDGNPSYVLNIADAGGANTLLLLAGATYTLTSARVNAANLTVNANAATLSVASAMDLAGLQLTNGAVAAIIAGGGNRLFVGGLSIDPTSVLSTNDNDVIVNYTGSSPIGDLIAGSLNGRVVASADAGGLPTYLAISEAADLGVTEFAGVTVDDSAVLLKYTYVGDGNLDGLVDALDYERVDLNIGNSGVFGTAQGDLNYDGVVDALDYEQIDLNVGNGVGSPLAGLLGGVAVGSDLQGETLFGGRQMSLIGAMRAVAAFSSKLIGEDEAGQLESLLA